MKSFRKILSACTLAIGGGNMLMGGSALESGVSVFLALLLWPSSTANDSQKLDNEEFLEPLSKARTDYALIQRSIDMLQDKVMAAQVRHLQVTAGKMLTYLEHHPDRLHTARRFIDYYQDRTAALMRQYVSLRATGLETQEIENLQRDMRTTFQGFTVAYEKQFAKVIDSEILDMDAKLKVAKQLMQDDGIDCNELKTPSVLPEDSETVKESKKETGLTLKQAGIAVGAVALGAVGLWKIFGGDGEKGTGEKQM